MKDIKIIKVKSEMGAGLRGASLGVDAIQLASLNVRSKFFYQYDSVEVKDPNGLPFEDYDPQHPNAKFIHRIFPLEEHVCTEVYEALQKNQFPIIIAGDHSTAYGTLSGVKKKNPEGRLGVVWIDAHADLHSPYTTPSGNMHGMSLAMACHIDQDEYKINKLESETVLLWEKIKKLGVPKPKVEVSDIVYIGLRSYEKAEKHIIDTHGAHCITVQDVRKKGSEECVQQAMEKLVHCDFVYVSFDVDSMDPRFSHGTGTPVHDGLTYEEAEEINRKLIQQTRVCAWEVAEINPILDEKNKMAKAAFFILTQVAELAKRKT